MSNVQNSTILMGLYISVSHVDLPSISQAFVSLTEDSSPLTALSDYPPPPLIVKFNLLELAWPFVRCRFCETAARCNMHGKLEPKLPVAFPHGFGEGER